MKNNFQVSIEKVTQWMSNYDKNKENYPVLSPLNPGEVLKQLPLQPKNDAEPFERIFEDFKNVIVPGITHWQHPNFFGYFPANSSPPSVLAEMLIASMGIQGMSWATSPAATELEIRMMEWLRDLFGLPAGFSGVIQDSASNSTLAAMLVAREKATGYSINENGYQEQELVAYCSSEAHSSVEKAAKVIGIGRKNLRKIPVNENQEMQITALEQAIEEDIQSGKKPFFVVGAFGTTGSTAVDSLAAIADSAKRYQLWFHVDAAYAGSVLILPEMRALARGIEHADSIVVNPHKWLLTNFDCSAFFIRDKTELVRTFAILPEYLKTPEDESVVNFRDWGLGLGRRFRSLKLWFVIRWYGVEGIQNILRSHIRLGEKLESWIREDSNFEVSSQRHFNLVCFRMKGSDDDNMSLLRKINQTGKLFLTHTKLNGRIVLRMVIGQTDVSKQHVQNAWHQIQELASSYRSQGKSPTCSTMQANPL